MAKLAIVAVLALSAAWISADEAPAAREPITIVSINSVKLPWNTTRNSWEETKEIASEHWRAIPFAQIAAAMFLLKTGLSAPYDLAAAPFRQKTRSEVAFRIQGRLLAADGKPSAKSRLVVRCTTPMELDKHGYDTAFYESDRFEAETDADGKLDVAGQGMTGASPRFMVHVDVEDGPTGSGSAGAFTVSVSTNGASAKLDVKGDFRLTAD